MSPRTGPNLGRSAVAALSQTAFYPSSVSRFNNNSIACVVNKQQVPAEMHDLHAPKRTGRPSLTGTQLRQSIAHHSVSTNSSAMLELSATLFLCGVGVWAGWIAWDHHAVVGLLASPILALGFVRAFVLQHDCGHGSFFVSSRANLTVGRALGLLTAVPFFQWTAEHKQHHATSGDLSRRGTGDIDTCTTDEFLAFSRLQRAAYRLYRKPTVLVLLGGPYYVVLRNRLPSRPFSAPRQHWVSSQMLNAVLGLTAGGLYGLGLLQDVLQIWLPAICIYATIGVAIFYVGHQFESTYWASETCWDPTSAALAGSSFLKLPRPLSWLTGNIGVHHIHHLNPKIPSYNLASCLAEHPELAELNRVHIRDIPRLFGLALWDSRQRRLVTIKAASQVTR